MTRSSYRTKRPHDKRSAGIARHDEWVTIPNAHVVRETAKALICDLGDGRDHPIAKSRIAPHSEVHHIEDRGLLIITNWLAQTARLMSFATAQFAGAGGSGDGGGGQQTRT
jgi:hypothetical protein